jgi:hypothetical protein
MKRTLKMAIPMALLFSIFTIAAAAQETEPIAGGYAKISTKSREAKKAAAVAIRQHVAAHPRNKVTLVKVIRAEQQVVAGMNYRVCLAVLDRRGIRRTITAVVYYPIKKTARLTDWSAGGCRDI